MSLRVALSLVLLILPIKLDAQVRVGATIAYEAAIVRAVEQGKSERAIELLKSSIALREAVSGVDVGVVIDLNELGTVYLDQGAAQLSAEAFERALTICEQAAAGCQLRAATLRNAALADFASDRVAQARTRLSEALSLLSQTPTLSRIPGKGLRGNTIDFAETQEVMARLLVAEREYALAAPLARQAASAYRLREDRRGEALAEASLAASLFRTGDRKQAQVVLEHAFALVNDVFRDNRESTYPTGIAKYIAAIAGGLGSTLLEASEASSALRYFTIQRASLDLARAQVDEKERTRVDPLIAEATAGLAETSLALGDRAGYNRAWHGALAAARRVTDAHQGARLHTRLARIAIQSGDHKAARAAAMKSADILTDEIEWRVLPHVLSQYRVSLDAILYDTISVLLSLEREGPGLKKAYGHILKWKGLLAFAIAQSEIVYRFRSEPELRSLVDDLLRAWGEIGALRAKEEAIGMSSELADRLVQAKSKARALEEAVVKRSTPNLVARLWRGLPEMMVSPFMTEFAYGRAVFRKPTRTTDTPDLLQGLDPLLLVSKADEALADYYAYDYFVTGRPVERRYAVIVSMTDKTPLLRDLPVSVEQIDASIDAWTRAVISGDSAETDFSSLDDTVWAPSLRALDASVRRVWICPDKALFRFPWQLAAGESATTAPILVSEVDSPRQYMTLRVRPTKPVPASAERVAVIGNLDYGVALPGNRAFSAVKNVEEVDAVVHAATETQRVADRFVGLDATKAALVAGLERATYVHLGTHGFFNEAPAQTPQNGLPPGFDAVNEPLLRMGLLLSNGNTLAEDGVLRPHDIIGRKLDNTRLVVMSACESGLGTASAGQGILGLRTAFLAAGARALVVSLWKVSAEATAQFMSHFYSALWHDNRSVSEALRVAQARMAAEGSPFRNPRDWAGWSVVGRAW